MSLEIARVAIQAAKDKKAKRLVLMDLRGKSDLCDFQLICSGDHDRQTRAIADAIAATCAKDHMIKASAIEGHSGGHWILLDFGSLIVHVFWDQLRDYYALESIWPASLLDLSELFPGDEASSEASAADGLS